MDTVRTDKATEPPTSPLEEGADHEETAPEDATVTDAPDTGAADRSTPDGQAADDPTEVDDDELDSDTFGPGASDTAVAAPTGVVAGAVSVIGAGLALASVTGTWLGTQMSDRKQLTGQIHTQSSSAADQIASVYGTPWHTVALFNGIFAVVAVLVAGGMLLQQHTSPRPSAAPWAKAVAWGAIGLGAIGLLIAGAMWFDLFTSLPSVPSAPTAPTG